MRSSGRVRVPRGAALGADHAPVLVSRQTFERVRARWTERSVEHGATDFLESSSEAGPPSEIGADDNERDDRRPAKITEQRGLASCQEEHGHPEPARRAVPGELARAQRASQARARRIEIDKERAQAGNACTDGIQVREVGHRGGTASIIKELAGRLRHEWSLSARVPSDL